jgi:pimeloyl-ACP methyl ester carboxylesterase
MLLTDDGVRIEAVHSPPRSALDIGREQGVNSHLGLAIVVAHGFAGSWRRPGVARVTEWLRSHAGVVSFDFRGHGRSGGLSTVGDREVLDLDAVVRWSRVLGYQKVATIGWSMGAAVAIRHAALHRGVDAVVAVSGPARWNYRGTRPMRRAHWAFERRRGRLLLRHLYGTRVDPRGWDMSRPETWPEAPHQLVSRVAPTPLLVVHGDMDPYFPLDHAEQLARSAGESAQLWVIEHFGHAENAASQCLVSRIGRWVREEGVAIQMTPDDTQMTAEGGRRGARA